MSRAALGLAMRFARGMSSAASVLGAECTKPQALQISRRTRHRRAAEDANLVRSLQGSAMFFAPYLSLAATKSLWG